MKRFVDWVRSLTATRSSPHIHSRWTDPGLTSICRASPKNVWSKGRGGPSACSGAHPCA
jgi:hypothetical protein